MQTEGIKSESRIPKVILRKAIIIFGIITFTIPTLFAIPFLSALGFAYYASLEIEGQFTEWKLLGSPPEQVTKIIGRCFDSVCVETASTTKYYNCSNSEACWQKANVSPEDIKPFTPTLFNPCMYEFKMPSLPIDTVQVVGAKYCTSGGDYQTYYALQEDGSIWVWNHTVSDIAFLGMFLGMFGALTGGFQIGIVVDIIICILFIAVFTLLLIWKRTKSH